ncbi:MAG TPA: efflux RND transporter periplasmic adaptor subunit [Myxococcales bacterium]|jgi:cobalt-zinc-cadmium efflux system membrane fusion protein
MRCPLLPIWPALLAALGACPPSSYPGAAAAPKPPPGEMWLTAKQVEEARLAIDPVQEQEVGSVLSTSGRIAFDDLRVAHVYSPVTGRVVSIAAQPGERVRKDQALAVIDSPDVGSAFSDLGKAQADLVAARRERARQKELYEAHAGARRDFEAAEDSWRKAQSELERAQQKARLFRTGLATGGGSQEFTLRSPIDGEVIARSLGPAAEVQGLYSGGNPVELFTVGELDKVWAIADVFEKDLAQVRLGTPATVQVLAYRDRVFPGKVDWIADALDPTTRTARIRCTLDNPDRALKPEMFAAVLLSVGGERALAVPRSAVLRLGDQTVVFVELGASPDGRRRFERRPVAVNEDEGGAFLPVTHGLAKGERVVTAGAILLSGML